MTDADGAQITASRTYYDGEAEQGLPLGELYAPVARLRRKHSRAQWIVDLARVGAMETG